jgi:hypothetical protein
MNFGVLSDAAHLKLNQLGHQRAPTRRICPYSIWPPRMALRIPFKSLPLWELSKGNCVTKELETQGKEDLGWGGGRGQGARRSIAGVRSEKNNRASLRKEASRRPPGENPIAWPNAAGEVNFAMGKEKGPAYASMLKVKSLSHKGVKNMELSTAG